MKLVSWFLVLLLLTITAHATPIPQGTAQHAAEWAAESVWGELNLLESAVLLRPDGNPSVYCFIFGRNGVTSIDESIILTGYEMRQAGQIEEGWEFARDPESYVYAIVSVDDQYGPILEMCDGLPAHKIFREDVKDMGEALFGTNVEIYEKYYLLPLENWYKVSDGVDTAIVNPRRMMSVNPDVFAVFETRYDFPGNPTAPYYWELVATVPVPAADDEGYIPDVPNYDQEDTDCGPHSSAQAVGYWDDHTYQGQGPWDLLIDTDFWGLRDEMRSAMGWVPGGGVTVEEIQEGIETVCNDPAYNNNYNFDAVLHNDPAYSNCSDAVDAGRPGVICTYNHPTYGNHAMTLVGYNDTPTQMIQVHDNWPPSWDEPWLEWNSTFDAFVDVFPSGGAVTPIELSSFTGSFKDGLVELVWVTACEINCYGYNILRVEDGGYTSVNTDVIPSTGSSCETATYTYVDGSVAPGQAYEYALQTLFTDGRSEISATVNVRTLRHELAQNMPNPFNPTTSIRYTVPQAGFVTLTVYDVMGHEVATVVKEHQEASAYTATFDGSGLASGIYFYRLQAGDYTAIRKMVLLK